MGMGGSGGGSVPKAGLTPLQLEQYNEGQGMIGANQGMVDVMGGRVADYAKQYNGFLETQNAYLNDMSKFADRQAKWDKNQAAWARGGLLKQGLHQMHVGMNQQPDFTAMQDRNLARFGVTPTADQSQQMGLEQTLGTRSTDIGLGNTTRLGLANTQRDMRFGGM